MDILFVKNDSGTYTGTSRNGRRRWRITPVLAGYRLDFRDPGDLTATYAGLHRSVDAAEAEAAR